MKKQSGFTLIELMVVMAIIAILATAGLAAYTGYIKKARDTTRIADISAINTIVLGMMSSIGLPPQTALEVYTAVKATNNDIPLVDPLTSPATPTVNKSVCQTLSTVSAVKECAYTYRLCDGGSGFAVGARFESNSNAGSLYAGDEISVGAGTIGSPTAGGASIIGVNGWLDNDIYEVGSCNTACSAVATGVDTSGLCTSATTDPIVPIKLDGAATTNGGTVLGV